jgi:hydrogenase 3 maturation protease
VIDFPAPRPARVAVLGVGNDINGDDGAGVCAVRILRAMSPAPADVLLVEAGTAPESYTGPLRRFKPDLIIEIDAAALDEGAGAVAWLDWRQADGLSASTHTLPPSVLATFLEADIDCEVRIIGIQPEGLAMGAGLSPAVAAAVEDLAGQIYHWLKAEG